MRLIAISTVILATLPVFALNIAPKTDRRVLAVFDTEIAADTLVQRSHDLGLDVVSFDPSTGHLIVQDKGGSAIRTLRAMKPYYVMDADIFRACAPQTSPSPRSA